MKTRILILALVSLLLSGCITTSGSVPDDATVIQAILNKIVPPNFKGDLHGHHAGHYFGASVSVTLFLGGLEKGADGIWTWKEGGYARTGVFSNGSITLKPAAE